MCNCGLRATSIRKATIHKYKGVIFRVQAIIHIHQEAFCACAPEAPNAMNSITHIYVVYFLILSNS